MKVSLTSSLTLVVGMALSQPALAQVAAPAVGGAAAPAAAGTAPAAAPAAAPKNIWSFLCLSPDQKAACKAKFCSSALGQLVNNSTKPFSAISGGLIPDCCPAVTAADLAKPADSSEGAAARIKADEANAKARRAAVRYLGTVDCVHHPEAIDALVNALRADPNECVRMEAAMALGSGCCCNKKTITALSITVNGTDEDGNPPENCPRVRAAAVVSLDHCVSCFVEVKSVPADDKKQGEGIKPPETTRPPEGIKAPESTPPAKLTPEAVDKGASKPEVFYRKLQAVPMEKVITAARFVLEKATKNGLTGGAPLKERSMSEIVVNAFGSRSPTVGTTTESAPVVVKATAPEPAVKTPVVTAAPHPLVASEVNFVAKMEPLPIAVPLPAPLPPAVPTIAVPVAPYVPPVVAPVPPPVPTVTAPIAPPVVKPSAPTTTTMQPVRSGYGLATKAPTTVAVADQPSLQPVPQPAPRPAPVKQNVVQVTVAKPAEGSLQNTVNMLLDMLKCDVAEDREWAATQLSTIPAAECPRGVVALMAACQDRQAAVRSAALRSLVQMHASTTQLITVASKLQSDSDPTVRAEAQNCLRHLGSTR